MSKNTDSENTARVIPSNASVDSTARAIASTSAPALNEAEMSAIFIRQSTQIEALTNATIELAASVGNSQAQTQRDSAFQDAMDSLKSASLAVRSNVATARTAVAPRGHFESQSCSGCSCVNSSCCTFNIYVVSIRALSMQNLELDDSVANPWSEMEIQMFAYLDNGIGAVIPSLFSALNVRKLLQYPGVPVTVERLIGQVSIRNGQSKNVVVTVDAIESDAGLIERATGGRDEEGSAKGILSLNCCSCDDQTTEFDLSFTGGGQGGGTIGIKLVARRSC